MAGDRFDTELRSWLAQEAPAEAPDRILDAVAARIDGIRTARGGWGVLHWLAPAGVAIVAALVVLGLGYALNVGGPTEPHPSQPAKATRVDCPTSPCSDPLLTPGAFRTIGFAVPMTFVVADARWVVTYDKAAFVRIERANDPRQRLTILTDLRLIRSGGYKPPASTDQESLVAWFSAHPYLVVTDRGEVSVGGLDGRRLDITARFDAPVSGAGCMDPPGCVPLLTTTGVPFGVSFSDHVRLYLLDLHGETLAVAVEARHDTPTDDFLPAADALLGSLTFGN
jgi:hypothetical protein